MPTKTVTSEVMKAGRGKHWTKEEIAKRKAAENKLKRKNDRGLYPPAWLSVEAKKVWRRVVKSAEGIGVLLDNIDTECLAIYCNAYANYQKASKKTLIAEDIKALQAWARIVAQFADKLGFTPTARARLVKKLADPQRDRFGEEFD